jgi:hypothetical protein
MLLVAVARSVREFSSMPQSAERAGFLAYTGLSPFLNHSLHSRRGIRLVNRSPNNRLDELPLWTWAETHQPQQLAASMALAL